MTDAEWAKIRPLVDGAMSRKTRNLRTPGLASRVRQTFASLWDRANNYGDEYIEEAVADARHDLVLLSGLDMPAD